MKKLLLLRSAALRLAFALLLLVSTSFQAVSAQKTVRILAIGNSFSRDAVEQNLYEIAAADGRICEVGNLYIGGCSLERHVDNARNDAKDYVYRKVDTTGTRHEQKSVSIREALCDGEWDFVSVQQSSPLSGLFETYEGSLPELLEYVKRYAPGAEIVFHQTWAYAKDSNHKAFPTYDCDQQKMFKAICKTVKRAVKKYGIKVVVPAGTAIQNARATKIGDTLNRDGYHLDYTLGRYTAACAWFEALLGGDVRGNGFVHPDIDPELQRLAQESAHAAVKRPYAVTRVGR